MEGLRSGADNAALFIKVKSTIKGSILIFSLFLELPDLVGHTTVNEALDYIYEAIIAHYQSENTDSL